MNEQLTQRAAQLLERGRAHLASIGRYDGNPEYWYSDQQVPNVRAWVDSVANLFRLVATPDLHYTAQITELCRHDELKRGVPFWAVQQLFGSLTSIVEEIELGLLSRAEFIFSAYTFDDFLEHAEHFHKGGKQLEAGVLVSIVFEDALRKIAKKYEVVTEGRSIEELIDALTKAQVWNAVKAKRVKGHAALRNKALHAQWGDYDARDVGAAINGVREMVEHDLL